MTVSTHVVTQEKSSHVKTFSALTTALIVFAGSALLAASAQFAIPLPFTPIPITMQTFAILILAGTLGSRLAALSCLTYLVEGTLGLPVFAHGLSCPAWFLTPRLGYVIGFVVSAYVVGKLCEKESSLSFFKQLLYFATGDAIVMALGTLGLMCFVPAKDAFMMGAAPFVVGSLFKSVSAACLMCGMKSLRQ